MRRGDKQACGSRIWSFFNPNVSLVNDTNMNIIKDADLSL